MEGLRQVGIPTIRFYGIQNPVFSDIPHLPRAALPRGASATLDRSRRPLREIKTRAASGKCKPAPQAGYFVPSTIIVSRQQKSYGMRWKCPSTLFSASCSLLLISQRRPSAKRIMNAIPMLPTSPAKHFALPFGRKLKMLRISTPRMATNKYDGTTKRAGPKTYPMSSIILPRCRAKWGPALREMSPRATAPGPQTRPARSVKSTACKSSPGRTGTADTARHHAPAPPSSRPRQSSKARKSPHRRDARLSNASSARWVCQ